MSTSLFRHFSPKGLISSILILTEPDIHIGPGYGRLGPMLSAICRPHWPHLGAKIGKFMAALGILFANLHKRDIDLQVSNWMVRPPSDSRIGFSIETSVRGLPWFEGSRCRLKKRGPGIIAILKRPKAHTPQKGILQHLRDPTLNHGHHAELF